MLTDVTLLVLPNWLKATSEAVNEVLATQLPEATVRIINIDDSFLADFEHSLRDLAARSPGQLILTLSSLDPTDFVPDSIRRVCQAWPGHKLFPGFGTLVRQVALPNNPAALLWDNTAGLCGQTLIVNLPDDAEVIRAGLPLLFPAIPNAIRLAS